MLASSIHGTRPIAAELGEFKSPVLLKQERRVSYASFLRFVAAHSELRTKLTAQGEIVVMPPASSFPGEQNSELTFPLRLWAKRDGAGRAYDSSAGFALPNGAIRSPDAA